MYITVIPLYTIRTLYTTYGTHFSHFLIQVFPQILPNQSQQFIKPLNPVCFHFTCTKQFAVVLDKVQNKMLLNAVFYEY